MSANVRMKPLAMQEHGQLQRWHRAETPSLFISHLCGRVWSDDTEREMGGIEREIAVILALTHSMRDLTILSTWEVQWLGLHYVHVIQV